MSVRPILWVGLGALGAALGALLGATVTNWGVPLGAALGSALSALVAWALERTVTLREPEGPPASVPLRQSRDEVREHIIAAIADNVPDGVVLFTETGTIRYSNGVARQMFFEGQVPEGENFFQLVSSAAAPLREALLGETDRIFSVDANREESYHLSRRAFRVDDEALTLLVVKHMTREIRRREVEVLKRVVRVISHEVNNSLAPISSLLHSARLIAENLQHSATYERVFDTIDERASHLRQFLEGYAALARLPKPQVRETAWGPLIEQVGALYPSVQLPAVPDKPGWFDGPQIEQVLINLIKNACESGPEPEVELRIVCHDDGRSDIEVLDRGPGFSDEALQNALLPLYTTKASGSGMGLALSREIVEAHGGTLEAMNRPGGGALLRVRLAGRSNTPIDDKSKLTLTRA